jgi:HD-like signal output (HDOD) protein
METSVSTDGIRAFVQGASQLPVLPQVTVRLLKALDSPKGSARDIARIVEAEPALAVRLLKLANSSFYGHRGTIATIDKAVAILGAKTIRSLALAVWTHALSAQKRTSEEMALLAPLLAHGLAAGIAARMLVERVNPALSEDAFMAGLLHDIGRVALVAELGSQYRTRIMEPAIREGVSLHGKEADVLGFDHRGLGSALMIEWTLPGFLAKVAEAHHDVIANPRDQVVVAAAALGGSLATRLGFNLAPAIVRSEPAELMDFFELSSPVVLSEFLEACKRGFSMMTEILSRGR